MTNKLFCWCCRMTSWLWRSSRREARMIRGLCRLSPSSQLPRVCSMSKVCTRGGNAAPPPPPQPLPESGSVMIWGAYCPTTPHPPPPTLLASCEISDIQPNHIKCTMVKSADFLVSTTERNRRPTCENFSHRGKREHNTQYCTHTHLTGLLWVLWQNLRPVAPVRKSPIPLPTTHLYTILGMHG